MDNQVKIIWILRIIILTLLIVFWITFEVVTKTDCQDCSFEINNKSLSAEEFFNLYHDTCIDKPYFIELPKNFTILSEQEE